MITHQADNTGGVQDRRQGLIVEVSVSAAQGFPGLNLYDKS